MKRSAFAAASTFLAAQVVFAAPGLEVVSASGNESRSVVLASASGAARIAVDPADFPVVSLAANLLADDVERVTGKRPVVTDRAAAAQMISRVP